MAKIPLKDSFLYDHMKRALQAEPDWTVNMYCAYNDIDDETREELRKLLKEEESK